MEQLALSDMIKGTAPAEIYDYSSRVSQGSDLNMMYEKMESQEEKDQFWYCVLCLTQDNKLSYRLDKKVDCSYSFKDRERIESELQTQRIRLLAEFCDEKRSWMLPCRA